MIVMIYKIIRNEATNKENLLDITVDMNKNNSIFNESITEKKSL